MDWRWEGTLWDFVDIVQWAMLMHILSERHEADTWNILSNPSLVREKADSFGLTRRAIVSELLRIGTDGEAMFKAIDSLTESTDGHDTLRADEMRQEENKALLASESADSMEKAEDDGCFRGEVPEAEDMEKAAAGIADTPALEERNHKIYRQKLDGVTQEELARFYGLSPEWIRRICEDQERKSRQRPRLS